MKSKHVFINESEVHREMRVYYVPVGISKREQSQIMRVLVASAHCPDIYFKRYDCEVCNFLQLLAEQVYDNMSPRDAWAKFHERNVRSANLSEIIKSLPILSRINPKSFAV